MGWTKGNPVVPAFDSMRYSQYFNKRFKFINMSPDSWKEYIDSEEDEKFTENIRKHTLTGRPLGRLAFTKGLEKKFGRRLLVLARG